MTLLAAYPLAKRDLPGRKWITLYFLLMLFFSGGLIPRFLLVRGIGLLDTRWALILPLMAQAYYVIIMRNFLMTIDAAYEGIGVHRRRELSAGAGAHHRAARQAGDRHDRAVGGGTALDSWFDALIYLNSESKWCCRRCCGVWPAPGSRRPPMRWTSSCRPTRPRCRRGCQGGGDRHHHRPHHRAVSVPAALLHQGIFLGSLKADVARSGSPDQSVATFGSPRTSSGTVQ